MNVRLQAIEDCTVLHDSRFEEARGLSLRLLREQTERELANDRLARDSGELERAPIFRGSMDAAAFLATPMDPPEWLIEGLLTRGGSGGLSGPPGVGKSNLIATWLPELVRADGNIMGIWRSPVPLRVMLIDAELSDAALHQRLRKVFSGRPPADGELHLMTVDGAMRTRGRPVDFMDEEVARELADSILSRAAAARIDVVVFDSLSGLWPGLPENSPPDIIRSVYPLLHRLRYAGCSAIYVHHDAKSGLPFRGSTAITQPLDFALVMKPIDGEMPAFCLEIVKQRHGFSRQRRLDCRLDFSADTLSVSITGTGSTTPSDILRAIDCAGSKPSVRRLAEHLGIAKSTLDDKLQWLRDHGYLAANNYEITDEGRRYAGLA